MKTQSAALSNDVYQSDETTYVYDQSRVESSTQPSITVTPQYDELSASSSSSTPSIDHSNNNRI